MINYNHLTVINSVKFTLREMDVIACLLSGKSAKIIAQLLSIEEKTVETHKYNIMRKLECNSKADIIHFIEKSNKFVEIKEHYLNLLNDSAFTRHLKKISLFSGKELRCSIVYEKGQINAPLLLFLEKHLKLAGVKLIVKARENNKSLSELLRSLESSKLDYIICLLSEQSSNGLSNQKNIIFLLPQENPYFTVFVILQKILPDVNLEKIISEFKEQYEKIDMIPDKAVVKIDSNIHRSHIKENFLKAPKNVKISWLIGGLLFFCIISFVVFELRPGSLTNLSRYINNHLLKNIRSDLPIPIENTILNRPALLMTIEDKFKGQQGIQTIALVGIGGAGKTTIARQYARLQKVSLIWEINAENTESIFSSFENLAYALCQTEEERKELRGIQEVKNAAERKEKTLFFVKEKFKERSNWLLIFDNVENFLDIQKFFPYDSNAWGKGKIIITTRNGNVKNNIYVSHALYVGELSTPEKLKLFNKIISNGEENRYLYIKQEHVIKFLNEIPPFPLDISVAAYYIKMTGITYEQYLKNLKEYKKDFQVVEEKLIKEASTYTQTRYNIIALSLKKVIETHKDFKDLLLFMSLLDSQNIPRDLLVNFKSDVIVDNFIFYLKRHSLISNRENIKDLNSNISIHRSTQLISLAYLSQLLNVDEIKRLLNTISQVLEKHLNVIAESGDILKIKRLELHYKKFLSHSHLLPEQIKIIIESKLGDLYYLINEYEKSKIYLEKSLKNINKKDFPNQSRMASILSQVGDVYKELGHHEAAKEALLKSCELYKLKPFRSYTGLAKALARLGNVFRRLGDYEKAKIVLTESLATYKQKLPTDYSGIAKTLAYLGILYRELGNYEQGKNVLEESLKIYKKNLPQNYADIAWVLTYLGNAYMNLGNYMKAKDLIEESLMVYKKVFPEDHPSVIKSLSYLGNAYLELGYYNSAKNILEKGLMIARNNFPAGHIDIGWISTLLGNSYKGLEDYKQARLYLEEALRINSHYFAEGHVEVAWVQAQLGDVYSHLGNYEKAEQLLEESFRIYVNKLGKGHKDTIRVMKDLGNLYLLRGNPDQAESFISQALTEWIKIKHPETYICLEKMADIYLYKYRHTNIKEPMLAQKFKIQAINYLEKAHEVTKSHFPEDSLHVKRIHDKLQQIKT